MTYYLTELPPIKAKHRIEFPSSVSTAYLPCLLTRMLANPSLLSFTPQIRLSFSFSTYIPEA
jgi:hypothetical protein